MTVLSYSCLAMEMPKEISDEEAAVLTRVNDNFNHIILRGSESRVRYTLYCKQVLEYATHHNYAFLVDQMITRLENRKVLWKTKAPKDMIAKAFFTTIEKSNIPLAKRFLQARKDIVSIAYVYSEKPDGEMTCFPHKTALAIAAENGDLALAQVLVQAGDDPNNAGENYDDEVKPLIEAARNNDVRAIQVLLAVGADPDILQSHLYKIDFEKEKSFLIDSFSALMEAARHRNCDAVEMLVEGVEYPPNVLANLMLELQKQKKRTYFSLLPSDLFLPCAQYLAPHFKIQADPNVKSPVQGKTPLALIIPDRHIPISKDERARLAKVVALLRSKRGIKIEKPAITLKELYNLPIHKS